MRVSKKALSVFMAILTVMTSLSVGFSAFAADDPYQVLADALKLDGVQHASWGSPQNYITVVNDSTGDIEKAAEAFWSVATAEAPSHTGKSSDASKTAYGVAEAVLTKLQNEYGVTGDDLSNARTAIKAFIGGMNGNNSDWKNSSEPSEPQERTYGIRVVRNVTSILLAQDTDVSKLPDSIPTAVEYTWNHGRYVWRSGFLNVTRNACNYLKADGWSRTETGMNTEIPAQLKAFGNYFTASLLKTDLDKLNSDELVQLVRNNQAAVDACSLWGNDAVMNHFFDKTAIKTFINDAITARDKSFALGFAQQIVEKMKNDPTTMEHNALAALLDEMNALKANLKGCTADAVAYALAETGLTMEKIDAFIASVNEEKEVIELRGFQATIDEVIHNINLATAADDEVLNAVKTVTEQYAMVTSRTQGAISRVFTQGTDYITAFLKDADVELQARKLEEAALIDYFVYFNADLLGMDLTKIATDELIDNYLATANTKLAEIEKFDQAAINRVFGDKYPAIKAYIASIDTTLTNRVEAQIDKAIDNYDNYGKITLLNYKAVKEAIGGVEGRIMDVIDASDALKAKYEKIAPMLEEYNAFVKSKGYTGYVKTEMEYPVRDILPGDIARTEGEAYTVTNEKLTDVIQSLDSLMGNAEVTKLLGLDGTLSDIIKNAISGALYTDKTVNSVVSMLYPMIVDQINNTLSAVSADTVASLLSGLTKAGLYIYPDTLGEKIDSSRYPEAASALKAAGNKWNAVNWDNVKWNVTDRASFVAAIGHSLSGLTPFLRALLGNYDYKGGFSVVAYIELTMGHKDVYNNAVLPLLEVLECDGVKSAAQFNALTTSDDMIDAVLTPLLTWVETVAEQPVEKLLDLLPKLAYIMEFGMIDEILSSIIINPHVRVQIIWDVVNQDITINLYETLKGIEGVGDLFPINDINTLIPKILKMVAPDANIVLPTINQTVLASHGEMVKTTSGRTGGERYALVTDKADTLLAVLRYVLPLLGDQDFLTSVFALVGSLTGSQLELSDDVMAILKNLGDHPDRAIAALTELFVPQEYASKKMTYAFSEQADEAIANGEAGAVINNVTYSENWTKEQAQYIADRLPEYIDNMMLILGGKDTLKLSELIKSYVTGIYTNETVTKIVLTVKKLLGGLGIDLKPVLGLVGIDLSSWDKVTEGYNWGFEDGDKDGFAKALTEALAPVTPILATVLADEDLEVLGAVKANGYPGYKTGILPILENLGCNPEDILSYEEYVAAVRKDSSAALSAILKPVLNLLEEIYTDPVNKVFEILPNLLYFINNDGLQVCVENTAQAIFVLLDTVRPIYSIDFSLNLDLTQLVINALAGLKINGEPVNLKIPFLYDLNMLTVGTVTPYTSKSGETAYRLENVDKADFVTVILRNVVEIAFYEDNINSVADLIANKVGMNDQLKQSLRDVLNTFAKMYQEDNGVDKILSATYTIFKGTDQAADGAIGALKDFNERWNAVFQALYNSGNEDLANLAKLADKLLDMITLGFVTGDGVGTNGLIKFFERLIALFQRKVTDISIDRTEATVYEGEMTKLTVSLKPSIAKNKDVVWASANEAVATVDGGVVTAVAPGNTMITATSVDGGFEVSCVIHVRANKTQLEEIIQRVQNAGLQEADMTAEQWATLTQALEAAQVALDHTYASQKAVDEARDALTAAYLAVNRSTKLENVAITSNGAPVEGEVLYVKVPWTKRWNAVPVEVGLQTNEGVELKSVKWSYANWSDKDQQATIESPDAETTLIRAIYGVGPRSCWIKVTVEDVYGNTATSAPIKVRFYNYDWQK